MPLCSLCQSIPFDHLPNLSGSEWALEVTGGEEIQKFIRQRRTPQIDEALGFPHHSNIKSLEAHAIGCELCSLMHESVRRFVDAYHAEKQDHVFKFREEAGDDGFDDAVPLWLTRRLDGGDGFLAFTPSRSGRAIYLACVVGFCVEDDSPLASTYHGRPVEEHSGGEKTLARAAAWVAECVKEHSHCSPNQNVQLPTRLLDLKCDLEPDIVRLCESNGRFGTYAALSHCWGKTEQFTTTRASMAERMQGIRLQALPKTFQDAIAVARRLSIDYLWIDSLCICQDDSEDWVRESAMMVNIYANAYLTIAASAAENNTAGCFGCRPLRRYVVVQPAPNAFTQRSDKGHAFLAFLLPIFAAADSWIYLAMQKEPLTDRAWALQERVISQRVIHYASDQMYYECNNCFRSEDGFRFEGRFINFFQPRAEFQQAENTGAMGPHHSKDHELWADVVEEFSRRQLTVATDKLPALSGMARLFAARTQASYVAGLWSDALIEGLSWQGHGLPRDYYVSDENENANAVRRPYIAPSWSWASYPGRATMWNMGFAPVATVLDYHVSPESAADPFGRLADGWVRVRGLLVPLSISTVPDGEGDSAFFGRRRTRLRTPLGDPAGAYVMFDYIRSHDEALVKSLMPLFALVLARSNGEHLCHKALVVAPDREMKWCFRRLGYMFLWPHHLGDAAVDDPAGFTTVILV